MAKNDNDDTFDYDDGPDGPNPLRRRKKRDLDDSANRDISPALPNPGQTLMQRKRKLD